MIAFNQVNGLTPRVEVTLTGTSVMLTVSASFVPQLTNIGGIIFPTFSGVLNLSVYFGSTSNVLDNSSTSHVTAGLGITITAGVPIVYTATFDDYNDFAPLATISYNVIYFDTTASVFGTSARDVLFGSGLANDMHGLGDSDGIDGQGGNDKLYGDDGNDILQGGTGDDTLNGGVGSDLMQGGAGNDTYIVDSSGDVVDETVTGSDGRDTLISNQSVSLLAAAVKGDVEIVRLNGSGNTNATGNALDNSLFGNTGNNFLNGGLGADAMAGREGNDTYILDNAGDAVNETGGDGTDTVRSTLSIDLTDTARFRGSIENASLLGALSLNVIGNSLGNTLSGNSAFNTLIGNGGNDRIDSGAGNDFVQGGTGQDKFVFALVHGGAANVDMILDYQSTDDTILLDSSVMTALGAVGPLAEPAFWASASGQAHDATDRILYDSDSGELFYDPDGTGALARQGFAVLLGAPAMVFGEFTVF